MRTAERSRARRRTPFRRTRADGPRSGRGKGVAIPLEPQLLGPPAEPLLRGLAGFEEAEAVDDGRDPDPLLGDQEAARLGRGVDPGRVRRWRLVVEVQGHAAGLRGVLELQALEPH